MELSEDEKIQLQCEARERYAVDMAAGLKAGRREGRKEGRKEGEEKHGRAGESFEGGWSALCFDRKAAALRMSVH